MTNIWLIGLGVALSGCLWATPSSDKASGYEVRGIVGQNTTGGAVQAVGGMAGLYVSAEADVRDGWHRAGDRNGYTGLTGGLALRASPLGMVATGHELERYFDFGAEAGAAATVLPGTPSVMGTGAGWVGGWVEIGTVPAGDGYVVLTGTIRSVSMSGSWQDQTVYGVGIGWRSRARVTESDLTFRD